MNSISIKSCKIKRVFVFISILFSLSSSYVHAYFIRGALYKKDDKIVIVLSDFHLISDQTYVQRDALISELDKFDKESSIIFVEDLCNKNIHTDHKAYQQSIKDFEKIIVRLRVEGNLFGETPLRNLEYDLNKKGFKVENVESGYMRCQLLRELSTFQYSNLVPKIVFRDVWTESQEQLKELDKQVSEIYKYKDLCSEKEFKVVEDYFKKASKYIPKGFEEYCKFVYKSFKFYEIGYPSEISKNILDRIVMYLLQNISEYDHEIFRITDSNIVFNTIKNNDKKVKVICAGYIHGSRVEGLLSDMGYKLIKSTGVSCLNPDPLFDFVALCKEIQSQNKTPINISELFKSFDIKNMVAKEVINTKEEKFDFGKNNFNNKFDKNKLDKKLDEIKNKQEIMELTFKILNTRKEPFEETKSGFVKTSPICKAYIMAYHERKKEIEPSEINKNKISKSK